MKTVSKLQQQSYRNGQAARAAAAANRLKAQSSGIRIVPLPNPDTDDNKRQKNGNRKRSVRVLSPQIYSAKKLPKFKSFRERDDERIAAKYDSIKMLVNKGAYLEWPFTLLQVADYAKRHNDDQFAIACLQRVKTDRLTPKYLEIVGRRYSALNEYMPEISRAVAVSAYYKMINAKFNGVDCDSARMQNGDTLLIVTDQYNPSLNPLVMLSCFYEPSLETERYKEAADSISATYSQWSDEFKNSFALNFLATLMDNGEYATALNYFGRKPLKQYPDSLAHIALYMATCATATHNDSLFNAYFKQALALDSMAANDYWTNLYDRRWAQFIDDPSQTELADWLIGNTPTPANNAMDLSCNLIESYWDGSAPWKWNELSDHTPLQESSRRAILHILDKGLTIDNGRSEPNIDQYISLLKAEMLMADPAAEADAKSTLENLIATDLPDLRCRGIISQAYLAGHGLDKPKDALKILKKNIKQLDNPNVTAYVRDMWHEYMAALYTSLGKNKDADKHLKQISSE